MTHSTLEGFLSISAAIEADSRPIERVLIHDKKRYDKRLAIVRATDNRAYFLEEGDRLFDGYLKIIHADSIVLVREIRLTSGKTITQNVTKHLRKP